LAVPFNRAVSTSGSGKEGRSDRKSVRNNQGKAKNSNVHEVNVEAIIDAAKTEGRLEFANLLDGACVMFEEQALREVVDHRGPHGVRLVANGVVDYGGVWAGKVGVGDATGGAVSYSNEVIDNATNTGKNILKVNFDKIPKSSTDLYLALTTPTAFDISEFSELHVLIRDAENPGHEIASAHIGSVGRGEAAILSSISRSHDGWTLNAYGCTCLGTARDYRQALLCLRAIQEKKHARSPAWPHQAQEVSHRPRSEKLSNIPRLPDLNLNGMEHRRVSAISSIASFIASLPDDQVSSSARSPNGTRTPSISSRISRGIGSLTVEDRRHDSSPMSSRS